MGSGVHFTEEEKARIIQRAGRLTDAGVTLREAARIMGIGMTSLCRILKKGGKVSGSAPNGNRRANQDGKNAEGVHQ